MFTIFGPQYVQLFSVLPTSYFIININSFSLINNDQRYIYTYKLASQQIESYVYTRHKPHS